MKFISIKKLTEVVNALTLTINQSKKSSLYDVGMLGALHRVKSGDFDAPLKIYNFYACGFDDYTYGSFTSVFEGIKYILHNKIKALFVVFGTDNPKYNYLQIEEVDLNTGKEADVSFSVPNYDWQDVDGENTAVWCECDNLQELKQMILFEWFHIQAVPNDIQLPATPFGDPLVYTDIPLEFVQQINRDTILEILSTFPEKS